MKDFIFGTATASYQIEGAHDTDGRTPSIWDMFSKSLGKVENGDNGDTACDHYNRYEEDVEIIESLGVDAYRFSISWSRIYPEKGVYNEKGMMFYKNLIAALKAKGIKCYVTLYHWDLPMWAYNLGGWLNRDVVTWFDDFSNKMFDELGETVEGWITHNEPFCAAFLGYLTGYHAPGHDNGQQGARAAHHMLLSHGKAVESYRKTKLTAPIGITLNLAQLYLADDTKETLIAKEYADIYHNRFFLDPLFKGEYPKEYFELAGVHPDFEDFVEAGDLELISISCDFLGINYYTWTHMKGGNYPFAYEEVKCGNDETAMGWDITPNALYELVKRLRKDYTNLPIMVTENGAAFNDVVESDGSINDVGRLNYIKEHLEIVEKLNQEGMDVTGYFLWSLLDNFEWACGYDKRFGIVRVDYDTKQRILKNSALWYRDYIKSKRI